MHWRKISGLVLLGIGFTASAVGASVADAAQQRDEVSLRTLLQSGVNVNSTQVDGTTALHWAAFYDDTEMAALLVRAGADVNAVNLYGVSPLVQACTDGNAEVVKLLLEAGADANTTMSGGETPLMLASRSGSTEAVKALLARGADPNSNERLGQTALMWAAAEGHTAVVRTLVEAGADLNARLDSGFTPFFFAVRGGTLDVVQAFLAAGVDVNAMLQPTEREPGSERRYRRRASSTSPLLLAVQNAHFELAIALVDAGADPNDVRTGLAPLHMIPGVRKPDSSDRSIGNPPTGSGRLSSSDFVREMVKRGADVNFRLPEGMERLPATSSYITPEGATPLLLAADRSDIPLMRLFLELGADPLLPNADNTTPLLAAAGVGTREPLEEAGEESEALEAVKLMLEQGADINDVDSNGNTAMHGAAYGISPLVGNLLAERGADPQVWKNPNKLGCSPLFVAEGYCSRLPRPDPPTIEAVTKLMLAAGLSTEGERPEIIDIYGVKPPKPPQPTK